MSNEIKIVDINILNKSLFPDEFADELNPPKKTISGLE